MGAKKREGIVYSTDPNFNYERENVPSESLSPGQQLLYIWLESKGRNGKTVTIIRGFTGSTNDLDKLGGEIKRTCGTGGSVKDGEIIIQGDFRDRIITYLSAKGYKTKKAGS